MTEGNTGTPPPFTPPSTTVAGAKCIGCGSMNLTFHYRYRRKTDGGITQYGPELDGPFCWRCYNKDVEDLSNVTDNRRDRACNPFVISSQS